MAKITLTWDYTDTVHPDAEFRIYENGAMIIDHVGALNFTVLMDGKAQGIYKYSATAVDKHTLLESDHSNEVAVNFTKPAAPTGLKASLTQ